jgi:small subunit ribosomal protein S20
LANTKSAQKAWRQGQSRTIRNQAARSAVRTYVKKATEAVASGGDEVATAVRAAVRALDRAAQRGIVHRNAAARRKSRLMARLHQLSLTPSDASDTAPQADPKAKPAKRGAAKAQTDKKPATARKPAARKPAAKT